MGLLDRVKDQLARLVRVAAPVDPATFNDPLALKTEWTPLARGGANFRTHQLVEAGPGRLEFRATLGLLAFGGVFLLVGLGAATMLVAVEWPKVAQHGVIKALPLLICAVVFTLVGVFMLASARRGIFDRASGWYWKGGQTPIAPGPDTAKRACRLTEVHAVQLIRERVSGKNSSYWSYELNLVLRDGRRLNVVDHGNLEKLRADAGRLARFLNCKLWDGAAPPP